MILTDLGKCTGCRRCETVCAFFHTGSVSNRISRIKVIHVYETGIDGPVVCMQCEERYCMICPADALTIGSEGQILHSPAKCTLCGSCEDSCPIGAIEVVNGVVYVCDLCGGDPQCIKACTEGAITYVLDEEPLSLEAFHRQEKMNPSEKQYTYIKAQGEQVREKWRKSHG
jgi:carbon-monoxide dehydrogenase iron sulfur subunit